MEPHKDNRRVGEYVTPKYTNLAIDYFEFKLFKKLLVQEGYSDPPLSPWKQEINLTQKVSSLYRRIEVILTTTGREFNTERAIQTDLVTSLICYPKPKTFCLVNFSEMCSFLV